MGRRRYACLLNRKQKKKNKAKQILQALVFIRGGNKSKDQMVQVSRQEGGPGGLQQEVQFSKPNIQNIIAIPYCNKYEERISIETIYRL